MNSNEYGDSDVESGDENDCDDDNDSPMSDADLEKM